MVRFLKLVLIVWAASLILYPLQFLLLGISLSELDLPAVTLGSLIIVSAFLVVVGLPTFAFAGRLGFAQRTAPLAVIGGLMGAIVSAAGIGATYNDAFTKAPASATFWIVYSAVLGSFASIVWCKLRAQILVA